MSQGQAGRQDQDEAARYRWQASRGLEMGPCASYDYTHDPRRLCFALARYKFCAKMLSGRARLLEVGCGDALGLPIVAQEAEHILALDSSEEHVEDNRRRFPWLSTVEFRCLDVAASPIGPCSPLFDAAYSCDVVEHIDSSLEAAFMAHICDVLHDDGVIILGTPNVTSEAHASPQSRLGHINLKDHRQLRALLEAHTRNTFMFSMNDEVVHTGYYPMAHYLFGVGVGMRR